MASSAVLAGQAPPSAERQARSTRAPAGAWTARGAAGAVGVFLASRLLAFAAFGVAAAAVHEPFAIALRMWDASWFLHVARFGYPRGLGALVQLRYDTVAPNESFAFLPGLPLAIRAAHGVLGGSRLVAGEVVVLVAGALAAVLCWGFVARSAGHAAAGRACALLFFFPGAFVLGLPYSEALMLLLVVGGLVALCDERWLLAGVLAAAASGVRADALALAVACAFSAAVAIWRRRAWRSLLAPALAPAGFLSYMGFLWARTGNPFAWFDVERTYWHQGFDPMGTIERIGQVFSRPSANVFDVVSFGGLVFVVAALALWAARGPRLPAPALVYSCVVVALFLGSDALSARPRFVLAAFPLVAMVGVRLKGLAFNAALALSAGAMVLLVLLAANLTVTP